MIVQWYANDWHILIVVKIWKMCQSLACLFCWFNKQYFFEPTWNFESTVIGTNMVLYWVSITDEPTEQQIAKGPKVD